MPEDLDPEVEECVLSVKEDNPDMDKSEAIAVCKDQLDMADGDCPEGSVEVNGECVEVKDVDAPPSVLHNSAPRLMASNNLDSDPIERDELGDNKVAYKNIKLLDTGVWTDQNSKTPTLYDEETFDNLRAEYDSSEYDGPPVNISHDVDDNGEPNEASVSGHIDPESLRTDGEALFGNIILDTSESAGAYADDNLKSALESNGEVGFSPSVEIDPQGNIEVADHPKAEHHATGGALNGLGLVRNPASKSVDFRHETRNRAVAMSGGQSDKAVYTLSGDMSPETREEIRAEVLSRELQVEDIQDDAQNIADELDVPVGDVMEVLDPLLDMDEEEGEDVENEEGEDEDDENEEEEEEEDEEQEMADEGAVEALEEQIDDLWGEIEEMKEEMMGQEMADEVETAQSELSAAKETIETLEEDKQDLEKRLEKLEDEPSDPRTLAEPDETTNEDEDWFKASGYPEDTANTL